jgi:hypothetical protein
MTAQIEDRFYFERRLFSVVDACGGTLFNPQDFGLYVASADDACRRGYVAEFAVDDEKRLIIRNLYASPLDVKSELGRLAVERLRKKRELARLLADFETVAEKNEANAERLRAEIAALEAEFPGFDNEDEFHRDLLARRADEAGLFDGAAPSLLADEDVNAGCRFLYEECDLPLDFTGTILLGADCVAEQSVERPFNNVTSDDKGFEFALNDVGSEGDGMSISANRDANETLESAFGETGEETTSYKTLQEMNFKNGVLQSAVDCSDFGVPLTSTTNENERAVEAADDARSVADWLERAFNDDFLSQWRKANG